MTERINIEQLVTEAATTLADLEQLAQSNNLHPCQPFLQAEAPDILTLIRAIDPTLLKHVWSDYRIGPVTGHPRLTLYARFGLPQSEQVYVILYAEE